MKQTLEELLANETLKFIFVGGKGGVGKTTTSSSIAIAKSQTGKKTLIISTDPAHNLSDAFNQQFTHEPTKVQNCENLYAMEIDPKKSIDVSSNLFQNQEIFQGGMNMNFLNELLASVPGIDEAIVFMDLLRMSKEMEADVVIFDTAPTGHTLKMLSFPDIMQKALEKLMTFKDKINSVFSMFGGNTDNTIENLFDKMEKLKTDTEALKNIMQNPDLCTFVAVCIPEFLSVYETERLVQELTVQNIDIFNIVVNQIVFYCEEDKCKKCLARYKMQYKYINQIKQLYEDFHLVFMPLEDEEIRGTDSLKKYSLKLQQEKVLPSI